MARSVRYLPQAVEAAMAAPVDSANPVVPLLERVARRKLSAEERTLLLREIASIYREWREEELDASREVRTLVGDFLTELRKIDESLKVLGVYLERIRRRLLSASRPGSLH